MGFASRNDLYVECVRLSDLLRQERAMSRRDWTRALLATEIVFASDVVGAGVEWETVSGWSDARTVSVLRSLQRRLIMARA